jgi:hypothetical protein
MEGGGGRAERLRLGNGPVSCLESQTNHADWKKIDDTSPSATLPRRSARRFWPRHFGHHSRWISGGNEHCVGIGDVAPVLSYNALMEEDEFHQSAARIDQHMQQLAAQGVEDRYAIVERMMGYLPALHEIWGGTSDQQLRELAREFQGFQRYALIMQEVSEEMRNAPSRPYEGLSRFSEAQKQRVSQLLTTAASLERGFLAFGGIGGLHVFQAQIIELKTRSRQWLADLDHFKCDLCTQGVDPLAMQYVNQSLGRLAERITRLAASG